MENVQTKVMSPKEVLKCPYNPQHVMPASQFQNHIRNKCKATNKHLFRTCKFNQ